MGTVMLIALVSSENSQAGQRLSILHNLARKDEMAERLVAAAMASRVKA